MVEKLEIPNTSENSKLASNDDKKKTSDSANKTSVSQKTTLCM